mgnify:CR=1 FL=1
MNLIDRIRQINRTVRPDEDIHRYVRYFSETDHGRKIFLTWLKRSGKYRTIVTEALRERLVAEDEVIDHGDLCGHQRLQRRIEGSSSTVNPCSSAAGTVLGGRRLLGTEGGFARLDPPFLC